MKTTKEWRNGMRAHFMLTGCGSVDNIPLLLDDLDEALAAKERAEGDLARALLALAKSVKDNSAVIAQLTDAEAACANGSATFDSICAEAVALRAELARIERERDHERSIVGLLTAANARKDAALKRIVAGDTGPGVVKLARLALAPAAPSASEPLAAEHEDAQSDSMLVSPEEQRAIDGAYSAERVAREWWDGNSEPCECDAVHAHMTLPALDALADLILERERSAAAHGELRGWEDRSRVRAALNEMRTTYKLNRHAQTWADFIERYPNE